MSAGRRARPFVVILPAIAAWTLGQDVPADGPAVPGRFAYCSAQSTSARGQGPIVTTIFRSRSAPDFIRSAFVNYLRSTYAPYGNGWIFSEGSASCATFTTRQDAVDQRSLRIARTPQPAQTVFNVSFQID